MSHNPPSWDSVGFKSTKAILWDLWDLCEPQFAKLGFLWDLTPTIAILWDLWDLCEPQSTKLGFCGI